MDERLVLSVAPTACGRIESTQCELATFATTLARMASEPDIHREHVEPNCDWLVQDQPKSSPAQNLSQRQIQSVRRPGTGFTATAWALPADSIAGVQWMGP